MQITVTIDENEPLDYRGGTLRDHVRDEVLSSISKEIRAAVKSGLKHVSHQVEVGCKGLKFEELADMRQMLEDAGYNIHTFRALPS